MIILASTADLIKLVTGSALAVDVHASWVDLSGTTPTPGRTNSAITTATTTNIVASPASSTQRNVKTMTVVNKDASASDAITVEHYDGTTTVVLYGPITLPAGWTLSYNENQGFVVYDKNGALAQASSVGRFLKSTLLTSASGNFLTSMQTNSIRIRGVGGGGGGAGCSSVASAASAGGGGGAGAYAEKVFPVTPNTNYAYTCGAAGTNVSGAAGGNGGNSTFGPVGGVTVTCPGGSGAPLATAATTLTAYAGGAGGAVATNGDVNAGGAPGEHGISLIVATPIIASGHGGSSLFGGGGDGLAAVGAGNNATGWGAGGGGAATGASTARAGGTPTAGCWMVDEFS